MKYDGKERIDFNTLLEISSVSELGSKDVRVLHLQQVVRIEVFAEFIYFLVPQNYSLVHFHRKCGLPHGWFDVHTQRKLVPYF